jgi:hypothetical protein
MTSHGKLNDHPEWVEKWNRWAKRHNDLFVAHQQIRQNADLSELYPSASSRGFGQPVDPI